MILAAILQLDLIDAAHSLSSPIILNEFISEADLPKGWVKRDTWQGGAVNLTYLRVLVSTSGQPIRCEVIASFGLPKKLDPCALALNRAKFRPGTDDAGKPIFGVTYIWCFWENKKWLGSQYNYIFPDDLSIPVNRLPRSPRFGTYVKVDVLSDELGHVSSCKPTPSIDSGTLGRLACTEIARAGVVPAKVIGDVPIRAVQSRVVRFGVHHPVASKVK